MKISLNSLQILITFLLYFLILAFFLKADITIIKQFMLLALPVYLSTFALGLVLLAFRIVFQKIGALVNFISLLFIGSAVAATPSILKAMANYSVFARALLYIQTNEMLWPSLIALTVFSLIIGILFFNYSERLMFKRGLISLD